MKEQLEEDWLDKRLREEAPYIDDAGFTARVIQKLPAAQSRRSFRELILLCATLLASIVAYFVSDGGRFLIGAAERFAAMPFLIVCAVTLACGLVITTIAAGAAFSKAREQSLG